jgi:hypothetical protein
LIRVSMDNLINMAFCQPNTLLKRKLVEEALS